MEIKGKVHCFFEQSGTFKNEFIKLGIPAEDYDIQNNFGQTDNVIDLFSEIDTDYEQNRTEQNRTDCKTIDLCVKSPRARDVANCIKARYDAGISNLQADGSGVVEWSRN